MCKEGVVTFVKVYVHLINWYHVVMTDGVNEGGVPVCGRKAMAAAGWLAALLCCGCSWKLEAWGLDTLLRGSYPTLAWPSWADSGWQMEWLRRTGVGKAAGKNRSLWSLAYLGVVGASPADCWKQRKSRGHEGVRLKPGDLSAALTILCSGRFLRRAHRLPPETESASRLRARKTEWATVDTDELSKHTSHSQGNDILKWGCRSPGAHRLSCTQGCLLGAGCWVLGAGCWVLGAGCWVLGAGCWVLGAGCWVLGAGCWVLGLCFTPAPSTQHTHPSEPLYRVFF